MNTDHKKRLQSMREVEELHPLMNKLLRKLPNVQHVEYTHGQNEMGSDFIVTRFDPILRCDEYVGVIVKSDKIAQDFTDIERQIDETYMPKLVQNGKSRINIREIWVVCAATVSKNAQDKINYKYSKQKIALIDLDPLCELIDRHFNEFWTAIPLETNEYISELRAANEEADRNYSLLQVNNRGFYIEQDIFKCLSKEYSKKQKNRAAPVNMYDEIVAQKVLLVEGGMGAGKSKLLRKLIEYYTAPETFLKTKILPLPVTYKVFIEGFQGDVTKLIEKHVAAKLKKELKDDYTVLLLIDAVDEKDLSNEEHVKHLKAIAEVVNSSKNTKAVITTRYLECFDENKEIDHLVAKYELRTLTLQKTVEFLSKLCEAIDLKKRIIEDLKKSQLFRELPHSPIAAIILAKVLKENSKEIPSSMTELYSKYLELALGRWDVDKGLQSQKEYQAVDNILMNLARYMLDNELDFISIDEAKGFFEKYLKERNLGISLEVFFNKAIDRCSILVISKDRNVVTFRHRTFAEFLYAKAMLRDAEPMKLESIFTLYWLNVAFFYLGQKKDCEHDLRNIINFMPKDGGERWLKTMNMSTLFLAAYTSPYHVVKEGVAQAMLDAASLYHDIVESKIESPLASLPRMHILCIMQYLIRQSYSYEFLRKAIEDAALDIASRDLHNDIKAYALFFLSVAYIDLGEKSFDFLLSHVEDAIPTDISLAMHHEMTDGKVFGPLIKRHDKKLKKALSTSASKSFLHKLYDVPVKSVQKQIAHKNSSLGGQK